MTARTIILLCSTFLLFTSCSEKKQVVKENATNDPANLEGKNTYQNPADGKVYQTEGEFKNYNPEGGKNKKGPIKLINIVLLNEQQLFEDIIGIEKLATFLKGVEPLVVAEFTGTKQTAEVLVQFTIFDDKAPEIRGSHKGELNTDKLTDLYHKIESYSRSMRTTRDSCTLQCIYGINTGG